MENEKIKIFVSTYACEPGLGSELGVGWHWVLEMSKYFNLWVLTRKSNQNNIEQWFAENEWEYKINFVYFDIPKKLRFWKKGMRGVRIYYVLWQKFTNRIVKKTMQKNGIKIYHLLTYGNALWPASKFGQKQTFIWGPTTAGGSVPKEFSDYYGLKNRFKESLQRFMAKSLKLNRGFIGRCRDAKLILCKTDLTLATIPAKYRHKAVVFTDVAVELKNDFEKKSSISFNNQTRYLSVGTLVGWRGFDVLIEAFAKAAQKDPSIQLEIVGDGSEFSRLSQMIARLNMSNNIFLTGKISTKEYYEKMRECDVVINPCLREGAVTVAFDSMALGKPLICIDTGGYTKYFVDDYAIILKLNNRGSLILAMEEAILKLKDKKISRIMGEKAKAAGQKYNWEMKGKEIYSLISKYI